MITLGKDLKGRELGKGISQRADGRYEARATIRGQKIDLYSSDLKQLRKDFDKARAEAEQDMDVKYKDITMDEWFEEWFTRIKKPSLKPTSTYPTYSRYKSVFKPHIGQIKLRELMGAHIQVAVAAAQDNGRAKSSIRSAVSTLRDCLHSAQNSHIISSNPVIDATLPWQENKVVLQRYLDEEERVEFLEEASKTYYKELYYIMLLTGMRIGEVGGLFWSDVDFKKRVIHINRSYSCQYHSGVKTQMLTDPKTLNSIRDIPFMGEVEEMFQEWKKKQDKLKKELGSRWRSEEWLKDAVFTTRMGSPVTRYIAEKEINKIVANINARRLFEGREPMPGVYPHALRHTFCSICFERGMKPKVVQMIMGHANYSTTMNIYTHVTGNTIVGDAEKFGTRLLDNQGETDEES